MESVRFLLGFHWDSTGFRKVSEAFVGFYETCLRTPDGSTPSLKPKPYTLNLNPKAFSLCVRKHDLTRHLYEESEPQVLAWDRGFRDRGAGLQRPTRLR